MTHKHIPPHTSPEAVAPALRVVGRPSASGLVEMQLMGSCLFRGKLASEVSEYVNGVNIARQHSAIGQPNRLPQREQVDLLMRYGNVRGREMIKARHRELDAQQTRYTVAELIRGAVERYLTTPEAAQLLVPPAPPSPLGAAPRGSAKRRDYDQPVPAEVSPAKPKRRARSAG